MPSNGVNASLCDAIRWQGAGCKPAARRAMQKARLKAAKVVCFHTQKRKQVRVRVIIKYYKHIIGCYMKR